MSVPQDLWRKRLIEGECGGVVRPRPEHVPFLVGGPRELPRLSLDPSKFHMWTALTADARMTRP